MTTRAEPRPVPTAPAIPGRRRLIVATVLFTAPRLILSALLWLIIAAAAPWPTLATVLVVAGGAVASLVAELLMVRLLWAAPVRHPTWSRIAGVTVLTSPATDQALLAGPRHLVVPARWGSDSDRVEVVRAARDLQSLTATNADVVYRWLTLPWQLAAGIATPIGAAVHRLPLVALAWRLRPIVAGIALTQETAAGRVLSIVGVIAVIGLTYLLPWTRRHWLNAAEEAARAYLNTSSTG